MSESQRIIEWSFHTYGVRNNQPLLLLHGFAGTHRYWERFLPVLQDRFNILAPDLPGHGDSHISDNFEPNWDLLINDFMRAIESHTDKPLYLVGYSMGARLGMYLLSSHPKRFSKALFISGSAGIENERDRALRWKQDQELAYNISIRGMEWFADVWERLPMFKSRRNLPEAERQSLRKVWLNQNPEQLAAGLKLLSVGTQPYLLPRLSLATCPMAFVAGSEDTKYAGLQTEYRQALPSAKTNLLNNCGHDIPREKPEEFIAILKEFLEIESREK